MNSQLSKTKDITEEEFRSCYPDVSIQHLTDKASPKVAITVEKRQAPKSPAKAAIMQKTSPAAKSPTKMQTVKTTQNIIKTNVTTPKSNITVTGKTANTAKTVVGPKTPTLAKTPIVSKTPVASKTTVAPKAPVGAKTPVTTKTPVPTSQLVKTPPPPPAVKIANLVTPSSLIKGAQTRQVTVKTAQNVIKQQTPNAAKTKITPLPSNTPAKEESPDQSTMTILNYHMPQSTAQRSSNQLTIEKIEQQQRIPVVLDTNNPLVLQQVISNGQLVLQNRVSPAETTVQSLVIGTTAQPLAQVVPPLAEVETTTSEPLHALQVTQQVTLFRPKGHTFTVDDVKKQINLNKQSAMTNVVSSTTNSIPAPVPVPTQSVQPEMKKVVFPGRTQGVAQRLSPGRQANRVSPQIRAHNQQKAVSTRQYQTTRGQVKKVSPKREIPKQKVVPMQPPPMPPPELQFGNEEEVTTSEEVPQVKEMCSATQLIVILPSGEEKYCSLSNDIPLNCTVQDLLQRMNVPITENMQKMTAEISTPAESFQDMDGTEDQFNSPEHIVPEPGEILGLHNDMEAELSGDIAAQSIPGETDESHKDIDSLNNRKTKAADSLTGESPKRKKICKKKKADEPVCLTISDDEELLGLAHHSHQLREETFHSDSNSQLSSCDKEPIITDEMVTEMKHSVSGGGLDLEEMLDNSKEDDKTYLQCRTVRIGSYKVVPKDKVIITPHGLKVTVPILNSDQFVELKILYHEIIKVLIHFGRQMPVLFFYTRPTAAAKIRKSLNMVDKNGFYYDTTSSDETHRRITFLPDKIDDDCKQTLKNIFGDPENNVFAELTGKEANDILVKASPKEVQAFILKKQPNNNNQQQQPPQPFNGQNIQTIMVYPPPPEKGGIPINTEDYACLGDDQFLNDVIIDFYLKYVVEKTLSTEDRARTHVFSSFFYKRLTTKPPPKRKSMNPVENDPTATAAMKRHSRVKSWTKNVDLFTKDFIVIPINENSHWFLAIICFPGLIGPVRFADNMPIELPGRKKNKTGDNKAAVGVLTGKHTVTIGSTTITAVARTDNMPTTLDVGDEEDRDEADGEDEDMDVPDFDEEVIQKPSLPEVKEEPDDEQPMTTRLKKQQREPIKQPCILIFDSLAGASRSRVVATLRDYLRVEYEAKHGEPRDLSGEVMKGSNVRCPQQTNYTDCGLYVLQYVEAFFQWPVTDYHIPIKQLQDWFPTDIVGRKRYEIQQLLHRLMEEQRIDLDALNLPILNLRAEGKLVEYSGTEEEDDDDDEDDEEQMCEGEEGGIIEDEGEFNDEMEHVNEDMEEGEIGHHDEEEDPDHFIDPCMDHEEHEMEEPEMEEHEIEDPEMEEHEMEEHEMEEHEIDEEEYLMDEEDEEDDELQEDIEDKELEDISLTPICPLKKDLKGYRIPRLVRRTDMTESSYKED